MLRLSWSFDICSVILWFLLRMCMWTTGFWLYERNVYSRWFYIGTSSMLVERFCALLYQIVLNLIVMENICDVVGAIAAIFKHCSFLNYVRTDHLYIYLTCSRIHFMEKLINAMQSRHIVTVRFSHLMPSLGNMLHTISWNVNAFNMMFLEYNLRTCSDLYPFNLLHYYYYITFIIEVWCERSCHH